MRGLPTLPANQTYRVRRWDAVILGGALPGLIAAVRLGMRGARVLILEEKSAAGIFPGLREPFLMTGSGSTGVLGACLGALGISPIERKRMESAALAYQVALPDARVDVGEANRTAEELESWGLAPREIARAIVTSLEEAAAAEEASLLAARVVRATRRRPRVTEKNAGAGNGESDRLEYLRGGAAGLAPLFDAQLRALSNFGAQPPPPAARSRLLGAALGGATQMASGHRSLRDILRQRIQALFGECRQIGSSFQLVSAGNLPAVAAEGSTDVCAGRALVINAPLPSLRNATDTEPVPELFKGPPAVQRRRAFHFRGRRRLLPVGMAPRVICVRDASAPMSGTNVVTVRVFEHPHDPEEINLVVSAVVELDADDSRLAAEFEAVLSRLSPLADDSWSRVQTREPHWDQEGVLGDPPREDVLRPVPRIPAYVLDRWRTGALGFEGDLLLGWRSGDAIAAELGQPNR